MESIGVLSRPAREPDAVVRYAEHGDGVVDIYLPPRRDAPAAGAVVFVHGGFWRQQWDRIHARPLAVALAESGLVVALPEYRRVGGAGGWPQTAYDIEAAIGRLTAPLAEAAQGGWDLPQPMVVAGHSAGGYLALWAGLRAGPTLVGRIVALAPVADIRWAAEHGMGGDAVQDLLGGAADDVPEAYTQADIVPPLAHASIPVTIVQGSDDMQVDPAMNRSLARRLPAIRYLELADTDHFTLIDPLTSAFADVVSPLLH